MKRVCWKIFAGVLLSVGLLAVVYGEVLTTGWGKQLTAGVAPQTESNLSVTYLSVYNSSTGFAYALVNCTTNQLTNAVAQGTAIILPPVVAFKFDTGGKGMIERLSYQSTSAGVNLYAAGF